MREIETDLLNNDPGGVLSMTMPKFRALLKQKYATRKLHTLTAYLLSDLAIAKRSVGIASPFIDIAPTNISPNKIINYYPKQI